jgi:hypothetical protein
MRVIINPKIVYRIIVRNEQTRKAKSIGISTKLSTEELVKIIRKYLGKLDDREFIQARTESVNNNEENKLEN